MGKRNRKGVEVAPRVRGYFFMFVSGVKVNGVEVPPAKIETQIYEGETLEQAIERSKSTPPRRKPVASREVKRLSGGRG